jgi:hypothetical protein
MTVGEVFLESLYSGVITEGEMRWLTTNQPIFTRTEEATALRLGRLIDAGEVNIGCRIPPASVARTGLVSEWLEPLGSRRGHAQ